MPARRLWTMPAWVPARRCVGSVACLIGVLSALLGCATLPTPGSAAATSAAGLRPNWPTPTVAAPLRGADGQPVLVALAPVIDARTGQPGRRLGSTEAVVLGVDGRELVLSRDAPELVDTLLREQLRAQGYTVVVPPQRADLQLEIALQALTLQVAARDARHFALRGSLRRQSSGQLLWSGLLERQDDRFAGVAGNDRAALESYLGEGLADVASRLVLALRQPLAGPAAAPMATAAPAAAARPPASTRPAAAEPSSLLGYVAVSSVPARARVYVGDVYHGLTPMTVELPAGVSQLHIKLDGWRSVSEKVAVRRGATVELELQLQR